MRPPDLTAPPNSTVFGLDVLKPTDIWVLASSERVPDGYGEHTSDTGIRVAFRPHVEVQNGNERTGA